ncbi:alpha/beta hydrolase family protein [Gottfriedia sp. NPDC056225]|uniref:alpha/beta hydrolase family protein n=1 Tax=Gottfriedia sp. NPDC056225 TaxID=3345751 RepID=UPI0035DA8938
MQAKIPKFKYIKANNFSKNKTVIMYHGWGSIIDSQVVIGEEIANRGFNVVIPEIIYHDTRQPLNNPFEKSTMQNYFWKTVFKSIDEVNGLIQSLRIDTENVILYGSSMGGFIASGIFFSDIKYAGLINVNGSSSFATSENILREMDLRKPLEMDELNLIKQYDPRFKKIQQDGVVLFLHGESDQIVPIGGQQEFYRHLINIEEAKRVKFITYENVNHSVTDSMVVDLIDWLETNYNNPI